MIPYISTNPTSAPYSLAITVGPGCGGKKPCATSKPESIGTHINIGDIFASRAIANKIGTRRIKPTSKKSAIPTINAEQTTAQSSLFFPEIIQHGQRYSLRTTRIGQQATEHNTEAKYQTNMAQRTAKSGFD